MKRIIAILAFVLVAQPIFAHVKEKEAHTSATVTHKIQAELKAAFPELQIDSISESPLKGIYQVKTGIQVLYVSLDGRYVLQGDLFDLKRSKTDQNVTENIRRHARADMLKELKTDDLIVFGADKPKGVITVIADLDCQYCKNLHTEMDKLSKDGIQVRYLAFPRTAVGTPSYEKAVSVWCSGNRKDAYDKAMHGDTIPSKTCINSVASQIQLGQKFGARGTPTIIFQDGSILPGYLAADELAKEAIEHSLKTVEPSPKTLEPSKPLAS